MVRQDLRKYEEDIANLAHLEPVREEQNILAKGAAKVPMCYCFFGF